MDLYAAHGGKANAGSRIDGNNGRRGGSHFGGRKGNIRVFDESPPPNSAMTIVEKKKLKQLKKKSWAEAQKLKQMKKSSKKSRPSTCNFYKKEGYFFRDCPE